MESDNCQQSDTQVVVTSCDDNDDDVVLQSIMAGDMNRVPSVGSRTVSVFISSTFSDMSPERNALMEHVYPQLKEFCRQQYRLEFRMMDLRWGIREQSHDDHTIIEFCLREIDKCKAKSLGPNFVALIGQKYGYRPFPPTIDADEFEAIRDDIVCSDSHQAALPILDTWFKKDTNIIPPVYTLQPISSILPDYADKDNSNRKKRAVDQWESVFAQLRQLLRFGVTSCVEKGRLPASCKSKYFMSVTEYEIERGMFSITSEQCNATSLCFVRHITNLKDNLSNVKAQQYIDVRPCNSESSAASAATSAVELDAEAQSLLCLLREKIPEHLTDERNVEFMELDWNTELDRLPSDNPHYIQGFCESFRDKMQWLISRAAAQNAAVAAHRQLIPAMTSSSSDSKTYETRIAEVMQHLTMCRERSSELRGRQSNLERIKSYVTGLTPQQQLQQRSASDVVDVVEAAVDESMDEIDGVGSVNCGRPLIVYGQSGSGKTSVMAKVGSLIRPWICTSVIDPVLIIRFLGTTSQSCNVRLLLSNICWQIVTAYKLQSTWSNLPTEYPDLVTYFHDLLTVATEDRPLILLLDGLDQLGSAHRAHSLAWLPISLPPFVRLVVSVSQQTNHQLLDTLNALLPNRPDQFVCIPSLGTELSVNVVLERLQLSNRTLTTSQLSVVERALSECSLPLYTSLVFEEVCRWASFTAESQTRLQSTVDDVINCFFDRLELYHGKVFVWHTLSYLTASRDGLSETELEDVLSLDDTVLNDVFQHWLPPLRRIPPLLIPRLLDELGRYIVRRGASGVDVIYWYHGQFIAVARRRYLSVTEEHRRSTHSTLAHYYLGSWAAGKRKPFRYSTKQLRCQSGGRGGGKPRRLEDEADRMVAPQPLYFGPDKSENWSSSSSAVVCYNLRKLSELPYHLTESRMYNELRQHVLFNYDWLHSKLCATSLPDVLSDFQMAITSLETMDSSVKTAVSEDIQLLASTLRVGGSHLSQNPDTLAFDLLGRLLHHYNDCSGARADDDNNNESYTLEVINDDDTLSLRSETSLTSGSSHHSCAVNVRPSVGIKSLLQQCDVKSPRHSALLPILQCFDPPSPLALFVLEGHSQVTSDLVFSCDTNELISVSKDGKIVFWDMSTGEKSSWINVRHKQPGRCTRLYLADHSALLILDCDRLDSLASVYDTKTRRELYSCGQPRLPSPLRGFLVGNMLCRQKSLIDVTSGDELYELDEFIESRSYVVCTVTPDTQFLLVGEPSGTRLFALKPTTPVTETDYQTCNDREYLVSFPSDTQPSAIAVSSDSRIAFIGHALDCQLYVADIDQSSDSFGDILLKFKCLDHVAQLAAQSDESNYEQQQRFPCEISELCVSDVEKAAATGSDCATTARSRSRYRVLLNVYRCQLVVLTLSSSATSVDDCLLLDLPAFVSNDPANAAPSGGVLMNTSFNYDGQLVIASAGSHLLVWMTETGRMVHCINLHTTPDYPIAVHPRRNLVATGSTVRTAVMVWDLDRTQTSDVVDIKVYDGPVDCVAVASDVRMVFVKSYHSLSSSNRSFWYFWCFAIDVWNLATGTCRTVLPFDKYGRLLQMLVSPDADRLALLLVNVTNEYYVIVFHIAPLQSGGGPLRRKSTRPEICCVAYHEYCSEFLVSPRWNFLATVSTEGQGYGQLSGHGNNVPRENVIRLWDMNSSKENKPVVEFKEATSPTFSASNSYLLYIDRGRTIIAYSLNAMAPKYRVPDCCARQLMASPANPHVVMATECHFISDQQTSSVVTVRDFKTRSIKMTFEVTSGGIIHVSADGKTAVDSQLRVYDLQNGTVCAAFTHSDSSPSPSDESYCKLAKLTDDGRYLVWIDGMEVLVGRTSDSVVVARTSTHERATSLQLLDNYGYVVVVGRQDGRLLTMKLVATTEHQYPRFISAAKGNSSNHILAERRRYLLDKMGRGSESSASKFHPRRITSTADKCLPVTSSSVCNDIVRRANVPRTVIDTGTRSADNQLRDFRVRQSLDVLTSHGSTSSSIHRSANPADYHAGLLHVDVSLIVRSATPSPATSRYDLTAINRSPTGSTPSLRDLLSVGYNSTSKKLSRNSTKRSRSAQDLFRLGTKSNSFNGLDGLLVAGGANSTLTLPKQNQLPDCSDLLRTGQRSTAIKHRHSRLSAAKNKFRSLFPSASGSRKKSAINQPSYAE